MQFFVKILQKYYMKNIPKSGGFVNFRQIRTCCEAATPQGGATQYQCASRSRAVPPGDWKLQKQDESSNNP